VRCLNNVDWACRRHNGDTETEHKTTSLQLTIAISMEHSESVDDGADDNECSSSNHTHATAKVVDDWTSEGQSNDSANLVHRRCQCRPNTIAGSMEETKEFGISYNTD
jgi:hypothetical protein